MKRIISFLVVNEVGVLSRVSGLLSKRGFNVDSITAGVTENESITRITLMLEADDQVVEQMIKQLDKLLVVKAIKELSVQKSTVRELALVKIGTQGFAKKELIDEIAEKKGVIADIGEDTATVQFAGSYEYINQCIKYMEKYGIIEFARTGLVALDSGDERL
ncbi:MAG: acetolactate synthase small subunit [Clostridia bacterium]|nr:acetolactate synthase small subunit [Clostridia bacterium]